MDNKLIHLWRGNPNQPDYAILDTPCFPARYYFGPVHHDVFGEPGNWFTLDNETGRFHRDLAGALAVAKRHNFDTGSVLVDKLEGEPAQTEREAMIAALEAARVFITPVAKLQPNWDEYKQDAADRINAALRLVGKGL